MFGKLKLPKKRDKRAEAHFFARAARDPFLTRAAEFVSIGRIYKFLVRFLCIITYCNFPIIVVYYNQKER